MHPPAPEGNRPTAKGTQYLAGVSRVKGPSNKPEWNRGNPRLRRYLRREAVFIFCSVLPTNLPTAAGKAPDPPKDRRAGSLRLTHT